VRALVAFSGLFPQPLLFPLRLALDLLEVQCRGDLLETSLPGQQRPSVVGDRIQAEHPGLVSRLQPNRRLGERGK
jgi:hypothetical protein